MERYDYRMQVTEDICDWIKQNLEEVTEQAQTMDRDDLTDWMRDELWAEDSVTGNASGSYFCNAWRAEEAICHNFDLLQDALDEFGCDLNSLTGAEGADVTIRCYLLGECISQALYEMEEEIWTEEEETEEEEA